MSIEAMKQALEALERLNDIDGMYSWVDTEQALRQAIEQAEKQEPDLPPVFIGVDVTLKGTQVNAFYRRPNDVAEMFYSEFHPLAKPEQEPVAWVETNDLVCALLRQAHDVLACASHPFKRSWVGLTDEEILDLWIANHKDTGATDAFARAIEAKLKDKNGGS